MDNGTSDEIMVLWRTINGFDSKGANEYQVQVVVIILSTSWRREGTAFQTSSLDLAISVDFQISKRLISQSRSTSRCYSSYQLILQNHYLWRRTIHLL